MRNKDADNSSMSWRFATVAVERDYSKAAYWYLKAAENGVRDAQHNLAGMYYNGEGVERDTGKAVLWFRKAAEQGISMAQVSLAVLYSFGADEVSQYSVKAWAWLSLAVDQGDQFANALIGSVQSEMTEEELSQAKSISNRSIGN